MRRFRTVRGTKAEAERVLNGTLREVPMGGRNYLPVCSLRFHGALAEGAGVSPAPFPNLPLV